MTTRLVRALACASVLALALAASLSAHETWVRPTRFFAPAPGAFTVRMTSGMGEHYPAAESAIEPSRIVRAEVVFAGRTLPLTPMAAGDSDLALGWTAPSVGIGAIRVELAPKVLVLEDSLIDVYFDEIGASPALRKQWTDIPAPKQWRESYVKLAKSYVRVGEGDRTFEWKADLGMTLEIVPESDPTRFAVGDSLRFRVRYRGAPIAGFRLASFRSHVNGKPDFLTTDRSGRVAVVYREPGEVLLSGVHLRRVREPGLEWRSDFTSLTFAVR